MAFKPTRNQTTGVQPVGVVPASGLRNMAQTFNNISQTLTSERNKDRQMLYNQAVLDAQAAGINAVKYDDDGKLVPLTEAGFDPNMFYKADEAKVKSIYEQFLQNSYKTAFSVDVTNAAQNAFDKNPNDPEAIKTIRDTYGESVDALPDILKKAVMPNFNMAFTKAISSAQANVRKQAIEVDIAKKTEFIGQQFENLEHLNLTAGLANREVPVDIQQDIMSQIQEASEELKKVANPSKVDNLINEYTTRLQINTFKGHILNEFQENGYYKTAKFINSIKPDLLKLKGLASGADPEKIMDELFAFNNQLHREDIALKSQINDENQLLGQELVGGILNKDFNSFADIMASDQMKRITSNMEEHNFGQSVLNHVQTTWKNAQNTLDSNNKKIIKESLTEEFSILLSGTRTNLNLSVEDMGDFDQILENAELTKGIAIQAGVFRHISSQYDLIIDNYHKKLIGIAKEQNDVDMTRLRTEIMNNRISPLILNSEEFINGIMRDNKISLGTDDKDAMTRQQWFNFVNGDYKLQWLKARKEDETLRTAWDMLKYGPVEKGSDEDKALIKAIHDKPIIPYSEAGGDEPVAINIFSEDPNVQNKSLEESFRRSIVTKSLHPQLADLFTNIVTKEQAGFEFAASTFQKFHKSVVGDNIYGNEAKDFFGEMFSREGIGLEWYKHASLLPFDLFRDALKGSRSAKSGEQQLYPNPEEFDAQFDQAHNAIFKDKSIFEKIFSGTPLDPDKITDPYDKSIHTDLMKSAEMNLPYSWHSIKPMYDLATIQHFEVTGSPVIMKLLKEATLGKIRSGLYTEAMMKNDPDRVMQTAIRDTYHQFGKAHFGLVIQGDGHVYLELNPITKYAQESANPFNVDVTMVDIIAQYRRDKYPPAVKSNLPKGQNMFTFDKDKMVWDGRSNKMRRAGDVYPDNRDPFKAYMGRPEDDGLPLFFKANDQFDPRNPSYSVFKIRPDGTMVLDTPHWSYDFTRSNDYVEYKKAEAKFMDQNVSNMFHATWRSIPFLQGHIMKKMAENRMSASNTSSVKDEFVRYVNKVRETAYLLTGFSSSYEPYKITLTDNEFELFFDTLGSLGMYQ